jgi:YesN/AraC family two-component response regulator
MTRPVTRIVICDDQGMVRAGFKSLLEAEPDLEVVGEASNGHEAIHSTSRFDPDVVLMDIHMPELDGIGSPASVGRGERGPRRWTS